MILGGCADPALEARRIPTTIVLSLDTGLLTAGQPTKLKFEVTDQNGEVMTVASWAAPLWEVSSRAVAEVSGDGTLTGTLGGRVTVTARLAGLEAQARFRINPEKLRLTAPAIYLSQAAQDREGTVRLIAGRPALLRIFAVGDLVGWFESGAQVTLLQDDEVVFEPLLRRGTDEIPTSVDESSLLGLSALKFPVPSYSRALAWWSVSRGCSAWSSRFSRVSPSRCR